MDKRRINTRKGQSVVEYLVLFSIVSLAAFLVVGNGFLESVKDSAGEIFRKALGGMQTPTSETVKSPGEQLEYRNGSY